MGKSTISMAISIAMLNYQRVYIYILGPFKTTESRRWQFLVNTMTVIWIQEVLGSLAPSQFAVCYGGWYQLVIGTSEAP